jgi:hypothetical protein
MYEQVVRPARFLGATANMITQSMKSMLLSRTIFANPSQRKLSDFQSLEFDNPSNHFAGHGTHV